VRIDRQALGERVAIRALDRDGHYGVLYGAHQIAGIDLTSPKTVGHVSEQLSAMSPG
jgi:putative transposase